MESRGIQHDRRYVVVDENDLTLTGRDNAKLPLLRVSVTDDGLQIGNSDEELFSVPRPETATATRNIRIWDDTVSAWDLGDAVAQQMSNVLEQRVRVMYMDDSIVRDIEAGWPRDYVAPVSFADAYPVLLINESSADALTALAEDQLDARRFRSNLTISDAPAWEEDQWKRVKIGDVRFEVATPCARCKFTTRDPDTAAIHPEQEPLRTLARHRRGEDGEVYFGQYLVPLNTGVVQVGDTLTVEAHGEKRPILRTPG